MTISSMRFIDRFVGVPLCSLVGILCRFRDGMRDPDVEHAVSEILVIKFFGIGSIVLATPSLSQLRACYPHARITFLTFETNRDLLQRIDGIDQVITIDSNSVPRFFRDSVGLLRHFRNHRYDIVFDFEFFSKFSTLLSGLTGARIRAAFSLPTRWRTRIVTHSVSLTRHVNVAYSFCNLVSLVTNKAFVEPLIPATPRVSERERLTLCEKLPVAGKTIISVNVNAGKTFIERRWPPGRFAELVSRLAIVDEQVVFCFTGTIHEREYVQRVIQETSCPDRCLNSAGILSIGELCALLERSDYVVSNDSGPLHIAAALGVPTIGLFGPESPTFYGPLGNQNVSVYRGLPCSPCMNAYSAKTFRCPFDAKCMKEITVDEVVRSIPVMDEAL